MIFSGPLASMTYQKSVSTQVTGLTAAGPGTQSSNAILAYNGYLFAVNTANRSLTMFSISATDATSLTLIQTADTFFEWPNSITAFGKYVCIVSSGQLNGIRCWTFNSSGLTFWN